MSSGNGAGRPLHPRPGWGHGSGVIEMREAHVWETVPAQLLCEVEQCVNRYSWAFDEHRPEALRDCFTEDAVWEASVMAEVQVGPFVGREEVLRWMTHFWEVQRDQRRHVFTNLVLDELEDDELTAYCYVQLFGSRRGASQFETAGFFRFVLRRVGAHWAIRRLTAGFDSPFWSMPTQELTPELRELFGVTGPGPFA